MAGLLAFNYCEGMALKLRIRELRESRGWSLDTLAGKVSVSSPHLSQVERGIKNLNNRLILDLSRHLGVQPYELFSPAQKAEDVRDLLVGLDADDISRVRDFALALKATRKNENHQ